MNFRHGTELQQTDIALVYNAGGIGDYIHWTTAIRWAVERNPHISGDVLAPEHFLPLAKMWLSDLAPRFGVRSYSLKEGQLLSDAEGIRDRVAIIPDKNQYANACYFHLMDLGFMYYCQTNPFRLPDSEKMLPVVRGDEVAVPFFDFSRDYAVVTTEATAANRMLPASLIEGVVSAVKQRGLIPVILGKKDFTLDLRSLEQDIDLSGAIDLRGKTTLPEAAVILAKARFVFGLDNGLLHLAFCSDVPVVALFTSVDPKIRVPRRRPGAKTIVLSPPETLACRFCNTRMTYFIGHDFKHCPYADNACTKIFDLDQIKGIMDRILAEEAPRGN